MIIRTSKKKHAFNEYFKNYEQLKKFIKDHNEFINVDVLEEKIKKTYEDLVILDKTIKLSIIDWFIIQKMNFKFKSAFKLEFWEERGYSINEFNNWINKRRKCNDILPLTDVNINKFKYGIYDFEFKGEPKCNLCKSSLKFNIIIDKYIIENCKNESCETNKNKNVITIRQLAFLPIELILKKNNRIRIDSKLHKEYWLLKGLSLNDSIEEIKKIKEEIKNVNMGSSEYYMITKGISKKESDNFLKSNTHFSVDYWINKGYSENEAKEIISKRQLENNYLLQKKRKEEPHTFSAYTQSQIFYWINKGYSENEASLKLKERQTTFSLKKCIEKYGEENGIKKFTERQNKWKNSLHNGGKLKNGYSEISQKLFYKLLEFYNFDERKNIYFATKNEEYILNKEEGGIWLYDFVDIKNKKIIEYNGDQFHGNPEKFSANDSPNPFNKDIKAKDLWEMDKKKINKAIKEGFEVLVIWDSEYRYKNEEKVIEKCINFLKNKI